MPGAPLLSLSHWFPGRSLQGQRPQLSEMLAPFSTKHRMSVCKDEGGDLANNHSVIIFIFEDIFFSLFPRSIPGTLRFLPQTICQLCLPEQLPIRWKMDPESLCPAPGCTSTIREAGRPDWCSPSGLEQLQRVLRQHENGRECVHYCKVTMLLWSFQALLANSTLS